MSNVKENSKFKRFISLFISLILVASIAAGVDTLAFAADTYYRPVAKMQTMLRVDNYSSGDVKCTNLGGISAGTANNRLFCIKSNSNEVVSTLYYYNNIYDSRFMAEDSSKRKQPKRIVFKNALLGHANAMAVDDNYLYVCRWYKKKENATSNSSKSDILKISRKAISELSDGATVTLDTQKTSKGTPICEKITPYYSNGKEYTRSICAITRYSYDKTNNVIKFLINYNYKSGDNGEKNKYLQYTIATYSNGKFVVSTDPKDIFTVENCYGDATMQDIFYDSSYGIFIPMWFDRYSDKNVKNTNRVLIADISKLKSNTTGSSLTFKPKTVVTVNGSVSKYAQYEVESIAFINRDSNKNSIAPKIVFSCNTLTKENKTEDRVEMITNSAEVLK